MNAAEQQARHTAVAQIARRQDDLELVVTALAQELVNVRTAAEAGLAAALAASAAREDRQQVAINAAAAGVQRTVDRWWAMTLGARLRWLGLGR